MRGATSSTSTLTSGYVFQSTLPYAGSDAFWASGIILLTFQSTLPYAGSDEPKKPSKMEEYLFQSTLPYAGSDAAAEYAGTNKTISIHAPLRGERLYLHL